MVPLPGAATQNKTTTTFDHSVILITFLREADHKSCSSSRSPSAVESLNHTLSTAAIGGSNVSHVYPY